MSFGASLRVSADRISIDGPRVLLKPSAVQGFALVLHELATNAAKHGALSVAEGRISVSWSVQGNSTEPSLVFDWQERGGPPAKPPEHRGFGSILLENALSTGHGPLVSSMLRKASPTKLTSSLQSKRPTLNDRLGLRSMTGTTGPVPLQRHAEQSDDQGSVAALMPTKEKLLQ